MKDKRRRITAVALGAALSLLLGSGLFALAQDTVRSTGNSAQSGTFAAVTNHDIKWARTTSVAACDTATYSDVIMTALISSTGPSIDLQTPRGTQQTDFLCLKNTGTQSGKIAVDFNTTSQTEVGACQASESTAGDTTCADAAAGEITPVLGARFAASGGTGTCDPPSATTAWSSWEASVPQIASSVDPGQLCVYQLEVDVLGTATDTQKLVAQTDRVQWDMTFFLQDKP